MGATARCNSVQARVVCLEQHLGMAGSRASSVCLQTCCQA